MRTLEAVKLTVGMTTIVSAMTPLRYFDPSFLR